jgi:hypothetical protein
MHEDSRIKSAVLAPIPFDGHHVLDDLFRQPHRLVQVSVPAARPAGEAAASPPWSSAARLPSMAVDVGDGPVKPDFVGWEACQERCSGELQHRAGRAPDPRGAPSRE